MRAALVEELRGIGSVELRERPDPTPAAGQALVRVRGAGVGPWDAAMISGAFGRPALPYIPGFEVAGVVESVGDGAGVYPGDRVYANLGTSAHSTPGSTPTHIGGSQSCVGLRSAVPSACAWVLSRSAWPF